MFPPTLLSCSNRFLRALQQNWAQSRLSYFLDWKVRLARYFTYYTYLFSFPLLICTFSYVAHIVGGSSQKARVHSRYWNYRNQFRKCTHFRYPNNNQLIKPFQWLLYRKMMPMAYRLSEMVPKINNWLRKEALRANLKYWGLSLYQESRSPKQPASQGLSILWAFDFLHPFWAFKHVGRKTESEVAGTGVDVALGKMIFRKIQVRVRGTRVKMTERWGHIEGKRDIVWVIEGDFFGSIRVRVIRI